MKRYRYWDLKGGIELEAYYAEVIGHGATRAIFTGRGIHWGGRTFARETLCDDFEVHLLDLPRVGRMTGSHFVH